MFSARQCTRLLLSISPMLLVIPAMFERMQAATVTVTPMVTFSGGLYHYNYSVGNTSATDLLDVGINVASKPGTIQNLTAPAGFSAFFDSGQGLVDFVENTKPFTTGTTVGGFTFDSALQPGASNFAAVGLDANQAPVNFTGATLAPVGGAAIPEPGTLGLLGSGIFVLAPLLRRRKEEIFGSSSVGNQPILE